MTSTRDEDEFSIIDEDVNDFENSSLNDNNSFSVEFNDGPAIKSLFEFLRLSSNKGNFKFSKNKIEYAKMDQRKKLLNFIEIDAEKIDFYEFRSSSCEQLIVGINLSDLRIFTKPIKKGQGIKIEKKENDSELYVSVFPTGNNSSRKATFGTISPCDEEDENYEVIEYSRDEKKPNFIVSPADFVEACSGMTSLKCNDIHIKSKFRGAFFESGGDRATVTKSIPLGNPYQRPNSPSTSPNKNTNPIHETSLRIKATTIKTLGKLGNNNLGAQKDDSVLKIFMEVGKPMKIITQIGKYGFLKTYVFDEDNH